MKRIVAILTAITLVLTAVTVFFGVKALNNVNETGNHVTVVEKKGVDGSGTFNRDKNRGKIQKVVKNGDFPADYAGTDNPLTTEDIFSGAPSTGVDSEINYDSIKREIEKPEYRENINVSSEKYVVVREETKEELPTFVLMKFFFIHT